MPLINSSSKESFKANIRKEIESGKKPKQAVAIAYKQQAKAKKAGK
jgi:hypothetical protein